MLIEGGRLTSGAVQVSEVEDIGSAAQGLATSAEGSLALSEHGGDGEGAGSESEDVDEEHVDGLVWWLV